MSTITITVPSGAGELAAYQIKFPTSDFNSVVETVGLLTKPSDVILAAQMGEFEIV